MPGKEGILCVMAITPAGPAFLSQGGERRIIRTNTYVGIRIKIRSKIRTEKGRFMDGKNPSAAEGKKSEYAQREASPMAMADDAMTLSLA